jgi:Big-like domain-containing protein
MLRKRSAIRPGAFLLLLSLLSVGCGDNSSSGGTLTGIDIAPTSPSITVGGTQQFTATGHFSNGPDQNITAQSNWSSSNTGAATIQQFGTSPGLATGVAVVKTTITASFTQGSSSVQGSTDLTVTSTVVVNPLSRGEGMVVLHGVGDVLVDGRGFPVSGSAPLTLAAGPHTFRTADGKKTLAMDARGGEVANIEIAEMALTRQ